MSLNTSELFLRAWLSCSVSLASLASSNSASTCSDHRTTLSCRLGLTLPLNITPCAD